MCYYKSISNKNQSKPMPTGGYNNIEYQSGVCTKYVPSPGGVLTKPIIIEESLLDKRQQT